MSIVKFDFNQSQVRVVVGEDGEPWFVAKDVCDFLGLGQISRAMDRLDEDERGLVKVTHPQNVEHVIEMNAVNESGLYTLILRSSKPEAKTFRKWITNEVLPSIRKTGSYSVTPKFEIPKTYSEALFVAAKLAQHNEALEAKNAEMLPKASFFDMVTESEDTIDMSECAKILNIPKFGRNNTFRFLRMHKVIRSDNTPYQKYVDAGFFKIVEVVWTTSDGTQHVGLKTVVFQKGLNFIKRLLLGECTADID